jgi:hypothetical protein
MPTVGPKPEDALSEHLIVIRRIPTPFPDEDGRRRVSKSVFSASSEARDPEKGMSVDLWATLTHLGIDPRDPAQFAPDFQILMSIRVAHLHMHGLWVVPRPLDGLPAHCNVLGVTKTKRKLILQHAEFLRRPEDVEKASE